MALMSKREYEAWTASTRDQRMDWWRQARFGMFVHYGLYSAPGRHEWLQTQENIPVEEYEQFANQFCPEPGAPKKWCALAKAAGMKYVVLTTRHHEGFSLWDSKVNPYNSVNYGPHRDIVREFVDACREYDLKIGFYSSLMDWHHPDGGICAQDMEARKRFLDYIEALNTELLTNYGKIDILWYDVSWPMESWEGWDSVARNQRLRALQPDIIINNRSKLDEDFGTPEGHVTPENRDWEACMTFNGISWGYLDEEQTRPYAYTAPRILQMLFTAVRGAGNLLLNIGPRPNGDCPGDSVEPLTQVGKWLAVNGEAVYGKTRRNTHHREDPRGNGVSGATRKDNNIYIWNWIWPKEGELTLGGYFIAPKRVTFLQDGTEIPFEMKDQRLILKNLPKEVPDKLCGVTIIKLEFDEEPFCRFGSHYPQLYGGYVWDK